MRWLVCGARLGEQKDVQVLVGQREGKIVLKIAMLGWEYNVKIGLKNLIVYISWNLRLEYQSRPKFILRCVLAKVDKGVKFW